jgi:hypothetical protein
MFILNEVTLSWCYGDGMLLDRWFIAHKKSGFMTSEYFGVVYADRQEVV